MKKLWDFARAFTSPVHKNPTRLVAYRWRRWSSTVAAEDPTPVPGFALRDYQEECIQTVLDHHAQDHRRLGISLATGSGKTVIFTQLIDRVQPLHPGATQTLIIAHRRELVEQAATHCRNRYPSKTVEIEMGAEHASGNADITVASIQSIVSGGRIAKFQPSLFKLILIDEAHHAAARSYRNALAHFGAMKQDSDVYVVGVSATFSRADGVQLGSVMDHIVYHKDFVSMIEAGWLSKVLFTTVKTKLNLENVKISPGYGDFNIGELSNVLNTPENNDITMRSWMEKAGDRKSTLVFCVDITHVIDMTNTFRRHGYDAFFITSDTAPKERKKLLSEFKNGDFPVLVNCGVFTEGTDIPNIDCVLLARPTRSRNLLVQMIGRGMRLHPDKEDCHIIDVVGSIEKGVITTPTLFGLPPEEVLDKTPANKMDKKAKIEELKKEKDEIRISQGSLYTATEDPQKPKDPEIYSKPWSVTFVDYDSIHDLLSDTKAEWGVRQYSTNAWVWVSPGKYVLACGLAGYITILAKSKTGFQATETRAVPKDLIKKIGSPWMRPRVVIPHADTFQDIVHGADTFVAERYPRSLLRHNAFWRQKPATDGQLEYLAKRTKKSVDEYKQAGLTKGRAGDMLTRLQHGARKAFDKVQGMKRKETKKALRESKLSTPVQEDVKVGKIEDDA